MAAGAKRCFNGCNLWPVIYRQNGFSSPAQTFLITFPYLSFWGWAGKKKILFKHNFLLESCHVEWDMLEEHSFLGPFGRSFHCTITIWWDATIIVAVRNVTHLLFLRGTPVAVLVHFLKTPWDRLMSVVLCPVLPFFPSETENVNTVSKDSSYAIPLALDGGILSEHLDRRMYQHFWSVFMNWRIFFYFKCMHLLKGNWANV